MKKILYANPVGIDDFDKETEQVIEAIRSSDYEPLIRSLPEGPPHLEYHTYEHEALGPLIQIFQQAEREGCLAGIIGCFYDGGLREIREVMKMPVVGMAEATLALAATMGHKFSIIVGRRKWIPKMHDNVVLYGHERRLASFRSVEMGIADVLADPDGFFDRCISEAGKAAEEDGAEVVVLSEMGSPEFWERACKEVAVPIVDPGAACWKFAEMVACLYEKAGISHSKIGGYEPPPQFPR